MLLEPINIRHNLGIILLFISKTVNFNLHFMVLSIEFINYKIC